MDDDAYQALRERCATEHPLWVQVAEHVAVELRGVLKAAGIESEVSSRAKDVDSLLRKMVFKYDSVDLSRAADRAGARVVVSLPSQLDDAIQVVRDRFPGSNVEDKSEAYAPDEFNYRGVHVDAPIADSGVDSSLVEGDVVCEIQIRTIAEHAWSELSHLLTYKSPGEDSIPRPMMRRVNRLVALVELFDSEARSAFAEITERSDYPAQRLAYDLERLHNKVVGDVSGPLRRCDPELIQVFQALYPAADDPGELLLEFASANANKLRTVVGTYDVAVSPFMRQPEAFVVWERLESDAVSLMKAWRHTGYPMSFLENMATVWGADLPSEL